MNPEPTAIPPLLPSLLLGMGITILDKAVHFYCDRSLANSTHKTDFNQFLSFCNSFYVNDPIPVSESLLCYFVASLARQGLAPTPIRTYLAVVGHAQIMRGFQESRQSSSLLLCVLCRAACVGSEVSMVLPEHNGCQSHRPFFIRFGLFYWHCSFFGLSL